MQKNITLSADETLIERSRLRAAQRRTTLNAEFRKWLERYAAEDVDVAAYDEIMTTLAYCDAGGKFSRDELNER